MNELIKDCTLSFDNYEYAKPKLAVEKFFWHTFCDNYLEIVKDRFFNKDRYTADEILSAQYTLYNTILSILKIIAPIMPHITEEIYHIYFAEIEKQKSIHVSCWPKENKLWDASEENKDGTAAEALKAGNLAVEVIAAVRRYKTENKMAMNLEVASASIKCKKEDKKPVELVLKDLKTTLKIKELSVSAADKIDDSDLKTNVEGLGVFVK